MRSPVFTLVLVLLIFPVSIVHALDIKVRIAHQDKVRIDSTGRVQIRSSTGKSYFYGHIARELTVTVRNGKVVCPALSVNTLKLVVRPAGREDRVKVNGRRYRGTVYLYALDGKVAVVEDVDLEDYVRGVLKLEINPGWPVEIVKAQAVCARTYAVKNRGSARADGYDLESSVAHQVYGGLEAETREGDLAVEATRGMILYYDGGPIDAFYCANNGGVTAANDEVWSGMSRLSYFSVKRDPFSLKEEYSRFESFFSFEELGKILGSSSDTFRFEPVDLSPSGRILTLNITGNKGDIAVLRKNEIRSRLGYDKMRSTLFTAISRPDGILVKGRGWGHGVGLSQWGGKQMAEQGYNYQQILSFYFPNTTIRRMYF